MIDYYKKACELGDSEAMYNLANHHKEYECHYLMKTYYEQACELGNSDAQYKLLHICIVDNDYTCIDRYYRFLKKICDNIILYKLGEYFESINNTTKMIKYYTQLIGPSSSGAYSTSNTSNAAYKLGKYYESIGNADLMERYYLHGAVLGNDDCLYLIANYYLKNNRLLEAGAQFVASMCRGYIPSLIKVLQYFIKPEYYRYIESCYDLYKWNEVDPHYIMQIAQHYEGIRDYIQMEKYYKLAGTRDATALVLLANYYKQSANYYLMEITYIKAHNMGNTEACYELGSYYKNFGKYELMTKYYKLICDIYSDAAYELGNYYKTHGDYELMKCYYNKACNNGNTNAMIKMGFHYQHSEANHSKMLYYYKYASDLGNKIATAHLNYTTQLIGNVVAP